MRGDAGPLSPSVARDAKRQRGVWLLPCLLIAGCFDGPSMQLPTPPAGDEARLMAALQVRHDAAARNPGAAEPRAELAMAYDVNGFPQRAIAAYGQAAALAPDDFEWPYFRALLMARENADYQGALDSLAAAIALDDGYVPAWLYRGEWLRELGRLGDARAAFERAAELGAGAPAIMGHARLLVEERRFEEAVAMLEPLAARSPDPRIEVLLGRAYRALGRNDDARIAAARGASAPSAMQWLDPRLARRTPYIAGFGNLLQHAQSLIQAGRAKVALPLAKELLAERPDDIAAINTLVWANAALERFGTAKSVLYAGLKRYPDEPRLHQMLANAYLQEGDAASARRHLEEVTKLVPDNARALEQLGWLLAQQGRTDEGIDLLERALDAGAREPKHVLYRLGLLHGAKQRWQEGAARFQEAVRIDAAFTMAYVHLGRCLAEAGRLDEAEQALDWADRLATHDAERASARRRLAALQRSGPRHPGNLRSM